MTETTKPSAERLRAYLYDRHKSPAPPPTPERIREELGWRLLDRPR